MYLCISFDCVQTNTLIVFLQTRFINELRKYRAESEVRNVRTQTRKHVPVGSSNYNLIQAGKVSLNPVSVPTYMFDTNVKRYLKHLFEIFRNSIQQIQSSSWLVVMCDSQSQ